MARKGIPDRSRVVAMGCTTFGEHWYRSPPTTCLWTLHRSAWPGGALTSDESRTTGWCTMTSGLSVLTLSPGRLAIDHSR